MAKKKSKKKAKVFHIDVPPDYSMIQTMCSELSDSQLACAVVARVFKGDQSDDFYRGMIAAMVAVVGALESDAKRRDVTQLVLTTAFGAADVLSRRGL